MKHYTYRITNVHLNKHYYGTRSANEPSSDLGIKYFSSSKDKDFLQDQKDNPQNYKYKIIKIFKTRKEALELEIKFHNKFDVGINESFYNRCKQTTTGFDTTGRGDLGQARVGVKNGMYGRTHTPEAREKIKKARAKQVVWNKGKHLDDDYKKRISETVSEQRWVNNGKKHLKIHKDELDRYLKDGWKQGILKNDLVTCKFCGKEMNVGNHNRWHGNNCKLNPAPIDIA